MADGISVEAWNSHYGNEELNTMLSMTNVISSPKESHLRMCSKYVRYEKGPGSM